MTLSQPDFWCAADSTAQGTRQQAWFGGLAEVRPPWPGLCDTSGGLARADSLPCASHALPMLHALLPRHRWARLRRVGHIHTCAERVTTHQSHGATPTALPRLLVLLASVPPPQAGAWLQVSWDMLQQAEGGPRLWSAEEPHLYVLVLSVLTPTGDVIEAESTQVRTAALGPAPAGSLASTGCAVGAEGVRTMPRHGHASVIII